MLSRCRALIRNPGAHVRIASRAESAAGAGEGYEDYEDYEDYEGYERQAQREQEEGQPEQREPIIRISYHYLGTIGSTSRDG